MYGTTIAVTGEDMARWRREGRDELLVYVGPEGGSWIDPETGELAEVCPFYQRTGPDNGGCIINSVKPMVCRAYPEAVHGLRCLAGRDFSR